MEFNIEAIRKMPNGSIKDADLIKEIAIYCIENPNEKEIADKVDSRFEFAGLYPYAMKIYNKDE